MSITTFDIASLTAAQLDDLIAAAGKRRALLAPVVSTERPPAPVDALIDPMWFIQGLELGTLFQFRHTGFGWISLVIPLSGRSVMLDSLQKQEATAREQAILAQQNASEAQPDQAKGTLS
ncbi:hypothetical protein LPN04_30965 [Rugamonas sp. A1-17]|nr:hypothetical protein [Rugamonas sp. A1-17]